MAGSRPTRTTRRSSKPRYLPRRKTCAFCAEKVKQIDYKEPNLLKRYLSDRCKIEPRRRTGNCAKHQRVLALAIKRARHLALLPYTPAQLRKVGMSTPRG